MLSRTHLAVGLTVALYFLPYVTHKWIFLPLVLISSILPDIDSGYSKIGKHRIFRPIQMVSKHRGILHTYTVCIIVSIIFALFVPTLALPFFLGYSFHLILDSFTPEGIKPFWPFRIRVAGNVKTGGSIDSTIFYVSSLFGLALFIKLFI